MESRGSLRSLSIIQTCILILLALTSIVDGQFTFLYNHCGDESYPPNGAYQSNLNQILKAMSSDTRITNGFYNFTAGQPPNRASSIAICRGDVLLGTCRKCINNSATFLPGACPGKIEAFGSSDYCTIYVSNNITYGTIQDYPIFQQLEQGTVSDASGFNTSLQGLLNTLIDNASSAGSNKKYATGQVNITGNGGKLYGLVQCTPDLDKTNCADCVRESLTILPYCCLKPNFSAPGVRIALPSCFVQYDVSHFFGNVPNTAPPPPPLNTTQPTSTDNKGKKSSSGSKIMIPISVSGISVLIILASIGVYLSRNKKARKSMMRFSQDEIDSLESMQFSFWTIKRATEDFKEDNKLGQGGFGTFYKGVLPNGDSIAAKRLLRHSDTEGDVQFKNEILIMAKLQHRNLVRLLGFCLHGSEMLLIYEAVDNGSLDKFLFDPIQRKSLSWETRYKVINGTARGLLYLHEESRLRIIHRHLKAANILLDTDFNPKIADFGMARLFNMNQTQPMTSRIAGTYGYMPPEYVLFGRLSVKSDVYNFGVIVLEIISGQEISSFVHEDNPEDLLSCAWKHYMEGTAENLIDSTLLGDSTTEILRCIHIGLLCVQESPEERPTMSSVVLMLSSNTMALPMPSPPAYYLEGNDSISYENLQGNTLSSNLNPPSVNVFDRMKEEVEAVFHHKKSPRHDKETHGRSDDIEEDTPVDNVKGPNVFERVKEEVEAIVEAIHPKKDSKDHK